MSKEVADTDKDNPPFQEGDWIEPDPDSSKYYAGTVTLTGTKPFLAGRVYWSNAMEIHQWMTPVAHLTGKVIDRRTARFRRVVFQVGDQVELLAKQREDLGQTTLAGMQRQRRDDLVLPLTIARITEGSSSNGPLLRFETEDEDEPSDEYFALRFRLLTRPEKKTPKAAEPDLEEADDNPFIKSAVPVTEAKEWPKLYTGSVIRVDGNSAVLDMKSFQWNIKMTPMQSILMQPGTQVTIRRLHEHDHTGVIVAIG